MRRVNFQVDRLSIDALVVPCYPSSFVFDFFPDFSKVVESTTGNVMELGPVVKRSRALANRPFLSRYISLFFHIRFCTYHSDPSSTADLMCGSTSVSLLTLIS